MELYFILFVFLLVFGTYLGVHSGAGPVLCLEIVPGGV